MIMYFAVALVFILAASYIAKVNLIEKSRVKIPVRVKNKNQHYRK